MSARRLPLRSRLARGYAAVLLVSGAVLLAGAYVIVARASARYDRAVTARVAQQLDQRRAHMFPGAPGAPRGVPAPGEARAQRRATVAAQRSALPTYRREIALEFAGLLGLVTVSSLGVGRLLAARALGPVRDITRAAQGIGEEDLDRRLGAEGPDDELTELARTLSGMLDRIRAAVEAQRAFAGHASHELRTPLSIIRAEIDACRDGEATSACGGSKEPADSPAHKTLAPLPRAGPGGPRGAQPVGFRASDGVGIPGRLFGHGHAAVVLAHMGNATSNESDWYSLARRLASEGYMVLTYNRRGVCSPGERKYDCSAGIPDFATAWRDLVGAARFVEARGATRIAVAGASIGGTSAVHAAAAGQVHPDALISLAGANSISLIACPGERAARATRMSRAAAHAGPHRNLRRNHAATTPPHSRLARAGRRHRGPGRGEAATGATQAMLAVVNDVVELSRLGRGRQGGRGKPLAQSPQ